MAYVVNARCDTCDFNRPPNYVLGRWVKARGRKRRIWLCSVGCEAEHEVKNGEFASAG